MNRDINWYMNTAKEVKNIKSDRKLATYLGLASVALWRNPHRPTVPEIPVMIKLAKICDVPEEIALLDRAEWEATFKAPETAHLFEKIRKELRSLSQYAAAVPLGVILYNTDDSHYYRKVVVRMAGLEPASLIQAADFKSLISLVYRRCIDIILKMRSIKTLNHLHTGAAIFCKLINIGTLQKAEANIGVP